MKCQANQKGFEMNNALFTVFPCIGKFPATVLGMACIFEFDSIFAMLVNINVPKSSHILYQTGGRIVK